VSVVIVNFQQADHVRRLVRQLDRSEAMRGQSAEIVIVDNDADPQDLHDWATRRPGIAWRGVGKNRGFARAVNAGVRRASGDWILLLNPDVSVPDEFLDQVIAAAEARLADDPNVGIIGFGLRHADGTPQASVGPFPTFANVLSGLFRPRAHRRCRPVMKKSAEVAWATGCCLLVHRDCWETLGGCDEDFFLYYEDVDLCRRAHAGGWTVWHDPRLAVTHFHPLHSRRVGAPLRVVTRHALLTYAAKHWPTWQFRLLARCVRWEGQLRSYGADRDQFQRMAEIARLLVAGQTTRARHLLASAARALGES
jgi:GT2 family glycosyltransferase